MVMLHGGGFCLGGLDNEVLICRKWCTEFNGLCINVDYRLAPEHPFPVPVNDGWDAVKWVSEAIAMRARTFADSVQGSTERRVIRR
jgi:acetyl esterase/lipase